MTKSFFVGLLCLLAFQLSAQNFNQEISNHLEKVLEENKIFEEDTQWEITNNYVSSISGVTHVYFRQVLNGIQINGTESDIHILPNGEILTENNKFVKGIAGKLKGASMPSINGMQAIESAAQQLNYTISENISVVEQSQGINQNMLLSDGGISLSNIPAQLVYHLTEKGEIVLTWDISIEEIAKQNWWNVKVDANTGNIIDTYNWMVSCGLEHDHSGDEKLDYNKNLYDIPNYKEIVADNNGCFECYEVFALPLESPYYGSRTTENSPQDTSASPFGWHDTDGVAGADFFDTRGNNVDAHDDGDNSGYRPNGGADLDFTGYTFSQVYTGGNQYEDASITNLFYLNNVIHDIMYQYGFDEVSGNFQENNYGNGGSGSDSVNANAQVSQWCNATFGTPSDGSNPSMNMYICNDKDGDFDALVVIHEFSHGTSNRLTGGPNNTSCLGNQEQMGEGWSDFYGTIMTMQPGDVASDARAVGTYLFGQGVGGDGIRSHPYSTDFGVNPHTYDDIKSESVPHGVGSVWSMMLWEMTWELIGANGYDNDIYNFTGNPSLDAGNVMSMALVTEGMKLQPCQPGFVDGRDAILAADVAIYGGANECLIWEAFARRGLGISASQGSSGSRSDGTEAFDTPTGVAAFTAPGDVCSSAEILTGLTGGSPSGGVYSGSGVTDDGNGSTYSFDPSDAGVGVHTITYDVDASTCSTASSASDTIEVIDSPAGPATTGASDFCVGQEVTLTAVLGDPGNFIQWYDSETGGNLLHEGESYTFTPLDNTNVYAAETSSSGPVSKLVISEITLQTPDQFEIQNVGNAFDYSGYAVAVSDSPYDNINTVNSIVQILGNMGADSVEYWTDESSNPWGDNIFWDDAGTGWIVILDPSGNVVDSVFWNLSAAQISGFNVAINGFNITAADLDWSGDGANFSTICNTSFRRVGDLDTSVDWSGTCESSDFGVANSEIDIVSGGCLSERTLTEVIAETEAPEITCDANVEISADANTCSASGVVLTDPVTSDNCGVASVTNDAPSTFPLGNTDVTWTVTDTAGLTNTCIQTVTVVDDVNPTISCAANVEISTDVDACSASGVVLTDPSTDDNCGIATVTNDAPAVYLIGDTDVTWTVTDTAGLTTTCVQVVTVVDTMDPELTCPSDLTEIVNEGELFTIPDYTGGATATDNCTTSPTITQDPIAGTEVGEGVTVITMTAVDDAGNEGTCVFELTVEELLGTNDSEFNNSIQLLPNPTRGIVNLINNSSEQLVSATIIDVNGRIIQVKSLSNATSEIMISLEAYASGMYFVKVEGVSHTLIKRIIRE
jgi:extracellular elastinolytic metalloproteinase